MKYKMIVIFCLLVSLMVPHSLSESLNSNMEDEPYRWEDYNYVLLSDGSAEIVKYEGNDAGKALVKSGPQL